MTSPSPLSVFVVSVSDFQILAFRRGSKHRKNCFLAENILDVRKLQWFPLNSNRYCAGIASYRVSMGFQHCAGRLPCGDGKPVLHFWLLSECRTLSSWKQCQCDGVHKIKTDITALDGLFQFV